MDVGVEPEFLIPGMQHTGEADLRAEMFGARATSRRVSALARNKRS
jgi:hypothetical protein